ncbi:DUF4401 domain-containing protein [Flammeovirga aprica]|uniref:DUF4401 domain-containing protein n=1 Tax=Flammeovirga aprica JL-4 TaxID=694437 RepID=A0A7X9X9W1_9BACT|nr:DUF4401 domain-containing protein [Flammeovirga aprica]NME69116.1 DUF4401 domain-containing protein [Flammeovirga aprica JL-4]
MNKFSSIKNSLEQFEKEEDTTLPVNYESLEEEVSQYHTELNLLMKVLIYFGGFLASLFFTLFIVFIGVSGENYYVVSILGLVFCGISIFISRNSHELFTESLATSSFLIGQIIFTTGLIMADMSEYGILTALLLLNCVAIIFVKRYMLVFLCTLGIAMNFSAWITVLKIVDLHHLLLFFLGGMVTYIFTKEGAIYRLFKDHTYLINPITEGLIVAFYLELMSLIFYKHESGLHSIWVSTITICGLIIYYLFHSNKSLELGYSPVKRIALVVLIGLPTLFAPYIIGSFYILILGVISNRKSLKGLGIISFISFIMYFYYDLNITLLEKSIALMISGIVFLGIYWFFFYQKSSNGKI